MDFKSVPMALVFLTVTSHACKDRKRQSDVKLVGGRPVESSEFPSSFYLRTGCTATKVADNLILTAAHCIVSGTFKDLKPEFDSSNKIPLVISLKREVSRTDTASDLSLDLKKAFVNPDYWRTCQTQCRGDDPLAALSPHPADVALLEVGLTHAEFQAVPVADIPSAIDTTTFKITGYGCEQGIDRPGEIIIRYKQATTKSLTGDEIAAASSTLPSNDPRLLSNYLITAGLNWNRGADQTVGSLCTGDSGGPLYQLLEDGSSVLVGVNSFALQGNEDSGVSELNAHVNLTTTAVRDWMASVKRKTAVKNK